MIKYRWAGYSALNQLSHNSREKRLPSINGFSSLPILRPSFQTRKLRSQLFVNLISLTDPINPNVMGVAEVSILIRARGQRERTEREDRYSGESDKDVGAQV